MATAFKNGCLATKIKMQNIIKTTITKKLFDLDSPNLAYILRYVSSILQTIKHSIWSRDIREIT